MVKRSLAVILTLVLFMMLVASCGPSGDKTSDEVPEIPEEVAELKIVNFGDETPRRREFFNKDLHDKVLNDLNIDLTVEILPWDSQNPSLMMASGEDFATFHDMCGGFSEAVSKGWFAEIPMDKIEKYCQDYLKVRDPYGFDSTIIDGKIYAIPFGNVPFSGAFQYLMVRQDLLDEVGIQDMQTIEDLENAITLVKEKHPDYTIVTEGGMQTEYLRQLLEPDQLMSWVGGSHTEVAYIDNLADDDKVYSWYESRSFENVSNLNKRWKDNGWISTNVISNPAQLIAEWKAGKALMFLGSPARPMEELGLPGIKPSVPDAKIKLYKFGSKPNIYTQDINCCYAVSAASENIDRYLMLFNWMNQSQENYDLLAYGVMDKDYTLNGERVNKLVTDNFWDEWQIANITYRRYTMDVPDDFIESYNKTDEGAIRGKDVGFTFDTSSLQTEIAKMDVVRQEKMKPIEYGFADYEENFPAALEELKAAGLDKYMAELQKQFSEWYASRDN